MNRQLILIGLLMAAAVGLWFWSTEPSKVARAPANTQQAHEDTEPEHLAIPGAPRDAGAAAAKAAAPEQELSPLDCDAPSGDIVTIDRDAIGAANFCKRLRQLAGPMAGGDPSVMERQGRALLDRMIDAFLVERALSQAGQRVSEKEIDAELERAWRHLDEEHKAKVRKEMEEQLEQQGVELATVRADLKERAALRKLVGLRGALQPNEGEIAEAYNADPTRFGTPRSATVEGFIARAAPTAPAHERSRAKNAADAFVAALRSGAGEAAALAAEHGLTRVAPFDVDGMSPEPELAAMAFLLPPGEWSNALPSNAGYTVLKVVRIHEGQKRPLAQARDQVIAMLESQREVGEQKRILAELRAQAVIVQKQW
jgi:hypothetical protein